jgi:hypothetical protein
MGVYMRKNYSISEANHLLDSSVTATALALVPSGTRGKITDVRRTTEGFLIHVEWETGVGDWLTRREAEAQFVKSAK